MGAIKISDALPYAEYLDRYPEDCTGGEPTDKIYNRIEEFVEFGGELRERAGSRRVGLVDADLKEYALQQLKARGFDIAECE